MGENFESDMNRSTPPDTLPWADHVAIFEHISSHTGTDGKLSEEGQTLPDEERKFGEEQIRWAAGAMDGTLSHHSFGGGEAEEPKEVSEVSDLIRKIAEENHLDSRIRLYELLCEDNLLFFIDPVIEKIVDSQVPIQPHLHAFLRFMAFECPDRGPVKFAVALLGLISDGRDLPGIIALGRHDEFTLFAAVAISNMLEEPDAVLWELGRSVDGWGRIQVVERLAETEDPEIKRWFLREGFRNSVMNEYLARLCAVKGGLLDELEAPQVDDELLDGATGLLEALIFSGPAADISDYEDGAEVVTLFVEQMHDRARTVDHLNVLFMIREFLEDEEADWSEMRKLGWTEDMRTNLLIDIHRIVVQPHWKELVNSKKDTGSDAEYWRVSRAAEYLNIDMWDSYRRRLLEFPEDTGRWFDLMRCADETHIDEITDLARTNIDLEQVAVGITREIGFGKAFTLHQNLDVVLQDLGDFPGKGLDLIDAALQSPMMRTRNLALIALAAWGESHWPEGMRQKLTESLPDEPSDEIKSVMEKVLMGEEL